MRMGGVRFLPDVGLPVGEGSPVYLMMARSRLVVSAQVLWALFEPWWLVLQTLIYVTWV